MLKARATLAVCFAASLLAMCGATAMQMNSVAAWTRCDVAQSEATSYAVVAAGLSSASLLLWAGVVMSEKQTYRDTRILAILILSVLAVPIGFVYWLASTPWTDDVADRLGTCGLAGLALSLKAIPVAVPFLVLLAAVLGVRKATLSRSHRLVVLAAVPLGIGFIQIACIYLAG